MDTIPIFCCSFPYLITKGIKNIVLVIAAPTKLLPSEKDWKIWTSAKTYYIIFVSKCKSRDLKIPHVDQVNIAGHINYFHYPTCLACEGLGSFTELIICQGLLSNYIHIAKGCTYWWRLVTIAHFDYQHALPIVCK